MTPRESAKKYPSCTAPIGEYCSKHGCVHRESGLRQEIEKLKCEWEITKDKGKTYKEGVHIELIKRCAVLTALDRKIAEIIEKHSNCTEYHNIHGKPATCVDMIIIELDSERKALDSEEKG